MLSKKEIGFTIVGIIIGLGIQSQLPKLNKKSEQIQVTILNEDFNTDDYNDAILTINGYHIPIYGISRDNGPSIYIPVDSTKIKDKMYVNSEYMKKIDPNVEFNNIERELNRLME